MNIIDTVYIGPMRLRLIEKPSSTEPDFFAPRYYLDIRHNDTERYSGIAFLDHELTYARRLFDRRVTRIQVDQDARN
jgi:hypothetical protein